MSGANSPAEPPHIEWRPSRAWLAAALPSIVLLLAVFAVPFLLLTENSFRLDEGLGQLSAEFTLSNYISFLTDSFYLSMLGRTFLMGLVVVLACVILGYPVAYFIARSSGALRGLSMFLVVAPLLISLVIRNLGMFPVLGESGLVNSILMSLRITSAPLVLLNNMIGVEIGLTHALLPLMILSLVVAIQSVEYDLELASASLGAFPIRTFFFVIVPLTRSGLLAGSMLVFTLAISAYTTPVMLGGNRVLVMSTFIGKEMLTVLEYGVAAACSVVLVTVTLLLTAPAARSRKTT